VEERTHAPHMASSRTPARRRTTARSALLALVAVGGGIVLTPLPAVAEPERPTTAQQAADLVAARAHDLEALTEQFNEAREQLQAAQQAAAVAADELEAAEAGLAEARSHVRAVARGAWTGDRLGALQAMLTSKSADELLDRVGTLQAIAEHNNGVLGGAKQATDDADRAQATADQLAAGAQAQVDRVTTQKNDLDAQIAIYQAEYDRLNEEEQRASRAAAERHAQEQAAAAAQKQAAAAAQERTGGGSAPGAVSRPAAAPPAALAGGSAAAQTAVSTAMAQIGDPYVWGAAGPDAFDCSGLTQYAYAAAGISLPHSSSMQSTMGVPVSRSDLQPGDLLFFYSPVSHVGMYIGDGQMVHAATSGEPVKTAAIDSMGSFTSARRIAG
jgi:cell wall-associated NlpC family hydrolase